MLVSRKPNTDVFRNTACNVNDARKDQSSLSSLVSSSLSALLKKPVLATKLQGNRHRESRQLFNCKRQVEVVKDCLANIYLNVISSHYFSLPFSLI